MENYPACKELWNGKEKRNVLDQTELLRVVLYDTLKVYHCSVLYWIPIVGYFEKQ